jgi:hypothetical protein
MNPTEFMAAFAAVPRLPAAACLGRHDLFDRTVEASVGGPGGAAEVAAARAEALDVCAVCPALADCRAYLDGLAPRHKPLGAIAGVIHLGRGRLAAPPTHQKAS